MSYSEKLFLIDTGFGANLRIGQSQSRVTLYQRPKPRDKGKDGSQIGDHGKSIFTQST